MEKTHFITITGIGHYYGQKPFEIDRILRLVKEWDNPYDSEAIRVELPYIGTIGYVANSIHTVYRGTASAGRIYDSFEDYAYAQVLFITHSSVIAALLSKESVESDLPENQDDTPAEVQTKNPSVYEKINASKKPIGFVWED